MYDFTKMFPEGKDITPEDAALAIEGKDINEFNSNELYYALEEVSNEGQTISKSEMRDKLYEEFMKQGNDNAWDELKGMYGENNVFGHEHRRDDTMVYVVEDGGVENLGQPSSYTSDEVEDLLAMDYDKSKMKDMNLSDTEEGVLNNYYDMQENLKKIQKESDVQVTPITIEDHDGNPLSWINVKLNKNLKKTAFGVAGVAALGSTQGKASASVKPEEQKQIDDATSTIFSQAKTIAPNINENYIKALIQVESTGGANDKNRKADAGKYGWLVGFTKSDWKGIQDKAKTSLKWKNLKAKMPPNLDTPENAIKAALVWSEYKLRDHTKEQLPGVEGKQWKDITATELYKLYNGNASPAGVKNFDKVFNDLLSKKG